MKRQAENVPETTPAGDDPMIRLLLTLGSTLAKSGTTYVLFALMLACGSLRAADDPLLPLSAEEITRAVKVLHSSHKVSPQSRFPVIALAEPAKAEVLALNASSAVRRDAFIVVYDPAAGATFEAVVDCVHSTLVSWKKVPGVQPPFTLEEISLTQEIVHADPQWQAAMRKRGIADFDHIQVDPWSAGAYGLEGEKGVRVIRALSYYNAGSVNPYARPIEGVTAYIDMNKRKVFRLVDTGVVPVATKTAEYDEKSVGALRAPAQRLEIAQPDGPGFEVDGNQVRWQNWQFRFAMHPRQGLILYTVGYHDRGRLRSILYRAALSEMVVPYGDPQQGWFFRNAFDEGEYGIGHMVDSQEQGTDAPLNARFFPAVFGNEKGEPFEIPRAVSLYERDGGLLWKHVDEKTGINQSRRSRELVLCWIATVGNYEYGFSWVFHQDGALSMEVVLTGIMEPKGLASAYRHDPYGHLVTPDLEAVHHQHFFNFRIDLDVDGPGGNSVVETNTAALPPGPANPYRNAFVAKPRILPTELLARRNLNLESARFWTVINPSVKNAVGEPVGYSLVPGDNAVPYASPQSSVRRRAGFLDAQVWFTPYDPSQMYAAGDYPNQNPGGEGLARWVKAGRSIEGKDVVLWYTLGVTHIPRPEDWPVMPVVRTGFRLVPAGFFDRNPALDLPSTARNPQ